MTRRILISSAAVRVSLGLVSRLVVLLAIFVALALPIQSSRAVVYATHTLQTPTASGSSQTASGASGSSQSVTGTYGTPTPTLAVYNPYQPAQTDTQYQGSPNQTYPNGPSQTYPGSPSQTYPGAPDQQSVSSPSMAGGPYPGSALPPAGLPGSAIVSGGASPVPSGSDPCYGDELITFSPEAPRIGNELLIAVTSAHPHPYGRLAGTEPTKFVRERPGQRGYVWEWTVQPTYPGQHEYIFYVDSTVPCKKAQLRVMQSLATRTPTPTKTPTPYGWNNNSNGNNNSNDNANTNTYNYGYTYPTSVPYGSAYAPVVDPVFYVVSGQDLYNCSSFDSQSNAQRVLRYDPTDPNNLDIEDGSADGVACSSWTYAQYPNDRDTTPVARVTPTTQPTQTPLPAQTPTQTVTPTPSVFDPRNYIGQGDRYGCRDFASHANAQAVLRADPTDPNRLDTNPRDGIACGGREAEADGMAGGFMPLPSDLTPVPRP